MELNYISKKAECLLPPRLDRVTNAELLAYFENTWTLYELLFSAIREDDSFYVKPDPLRNPLVFYLGHTAAFYVNKLVMAGLLDRGINPYFEELFAKGVDPDLPEHLETRAVWPAIPEVRAYRERVYQVVKTLIQSTDFDLPITEHHPCWSLMMGLEHDRIHFETSSVLIRQLDVDLVKMPEEWRYAPTLGNVPGNEWLDVQGGRVKLGRPADAPVFGWDNEYGSLEVSVPAFRVMRNLVTNAEYLEFVEAGAYLDPAYWSEEGWAWRTRTGTGYPRFWVETGNGFAYRAMFDLLPMPLDWPVEVNAHEATAYLHWKGAGFRLLSEAEFMLLANQQDDPLTSAQYNLHFRFCSSAPVGFEQEDTPGCTDLWGNVWDWLSDDFYPLPGFETHYLYEDFSNVYMDADHSMLLGGAWTTTGTGASRYYRLWFRRHFYQHAGFRLAQNLPA